MKRLVLVVLVLLAADRVMAEGRPKPKPETRDKRSSDPTSEEAAKARAREAEKAAELRKANPTAGDAAGNTRGVIGGETDTQAPSSAQKKDRPSEIVRQKGKPPLHDSKAADPKQRSVVTDEATYPNGFTDEQIAGLLKKLPPESRKPFEDANIKAEKPEEAMTAEAKKGRNLRDGAALAIRAGLAWTQKTAQTFSRLIMGRLTSNSKMDSKKALDTAVTLTCSGKDRCGHSGLNLPCRHLAKLQAAVAGLGVAAAALVIERYLDPNTVIADDAKTLDLNKKGETKEHLVLTGLDIPITEESDSASQDPKP